MKKMLMALCLLFNSITASLHDLKAPILTISKLYVEVVSVKNSQVKLKFMLNGCLDRLGPVSYKFSRKNWRTTLFVSAVNLHVKGSETVRCFSPNYKVITLEAPFFVNKWSLKVETLGEVKPSLKGFLRTGRMAIGGETTGVELVTENDEVYELIIPAHLKRSLRSFSSRNVIVTGEFTTLEGIERPARKAFHVKTLELAE